MKRGWWMIIFASGNAYFYDNPYRVIQRKIGTAITCQLPGPQIRKRSQPVWCSDNCSGFHYRNGNIIGVGTAIALGGPGAVLWCWPTGVFGIATDTVNPLLPVKYRVKNGRMQGGAM